MSLDRLYKAAALAAIALASLAPSMSHGFELRVVPYLSAREEYNSNLFLTRTGREESWITALSPGVDAKARTERVDAGISANLNWLRYGSESDLDATDYAAGGRFRYRLLPRLRVAGTGGYRRESRPDRHFEEAGLVDKSRDTRLDAALGTDWAMTEKSAVALSYAFERLDYPSQPQNDSTNNTVVAALAHDLAQSFALTKARVAGGYNHGAYPGMTINNYILTVGASRAVRELWSVAANVGGRYTRSEFDAPGGRIRETSTGWVADASVLYKGELTRGTLTFSHDVAPAYGSVGAVLRTSAVFSVGRQFLERLSGTLSGGYYLNKSKAGQFSTQPIDERSARLQPVLRWEMEKYLALEGSYQVSWVDYRLRDERVVQHVAYVGATLSYPLFGGADRGESP